MTDDKQPDTVAADQGRSLAEAGQWTLVWRRFRRHKLAFASLWVVLAMYLMAAFCEIIAPYNPDSRDLRYLWGAPQKLHFVRPDGQFSLRPFVYGYCRDNREDPWSITLKPDSSRVYDVHFLVKGEPYRMWGILPMDRHLFGVIGADGEPGYIHLFGTDRQGRDMLSRIIYGSRISLTIGLVGVAMTFVLGVLIGGIAGYAGGWTDLAIQRLMEVLHSIPGLPLWMGLSAALPATWSGVKVY